MHAKAWLIVQDCLKLKDVAESLKRQYESREDELLSGAYNDFDYIMGVYQRPSVENLALDLAELSQAHEKKMKDINNHLDTYNKALDTLDDLERFEFYEAISDEDLMLYDMKLARTMIKVGTFISEHHNIDCDLEERTTKERFIKRAAFETKFEIRQNKFKGVL